jgi:hypothetical protein
MSQRKLILEAELTVAPLSKEDCEDVGVRESEYDGDGAIGYVDVDPSDLIDMINEKLADLYDDISETHVDLDGVYDVKIKRLRLKLK